MISLIPSLPFIATIGDIMSREVGHVAVGRVALTLAGGLGNGSR